MRIVPFLLIPVFLQLCLRPCISRADAHELPLCAPNLAEGQISPKSQITYKVIILFCKAVQFWGDYGEITIMDPRSGRNLTTHLDSSPLCEGQGTEHNPWLLLKTEKIGTLWKFVVPQNFPGDSHTMSPRSQMLHSPSPTSLLPCLPGSPHYSQSP